jgi:hypothetical protein
MFLCMFGRAGEPHTWFLPVFESLTGYAVIACSLWTLIMGCQCVVGPSVWGKYGPGRGACFTGTDLKGVASGSATPSPSHNVTQHSLLLYNSAFMTARKWSTLPAHGLIVRSERRSRCPAGAWAQLLGPPVRGVSLLQGAHDASFPCFSLHWQVDSYPIPVWLQLVGAANIVLTLFTFLTYCMCCPPNKFIFFSQSTTTTNTGYNTITRTTTTTRETFHLVSDPDEEEPPWHVRACQCRRTGMRHHDACTLART